jgi:hypothetical protein
MERYSVIKEKNPREIVLLRGRGCAYKKCTFCDYHTDRCADDEENFQLNKSVLEKVTGEYGDLEVINSGSVFELDSKTLELIKTVCCDKKIKTLHFESHYIYNNQIEKIRAFYIGIDVKMKLGLETFDYDFRENVLNKGIAEKEPKLISQNFDEANLLFGLTGQTLESMENDIQLGLKYFQRLCINIMCHNTTSVKPNQNVIKDFLDFIYPKYKDDNRVDILINNTDFGVGD